MQKRLAQAEMRSRKLLAEGRQQKLRIGVLALQVGPHIAAKCNGISKQKVSYWMKKLTVPEFHGQRHGGVRNEKFRSDERELIELAIFQRCETHPFSRLEEFKDYL